MMPLTGVSRNVLYTSINLNTGDTMIARTWRGTVRAAEAEAYLEYLRKTGLESFSATPGNRGALALRRTVNDLTEFLIVSFWDSADAIRTFAGHDIERAVFYPDDDRFLVERDTHVTHFEVAYESADIARGRSAGADAQLPASEPAR